MFLYVIMTIYWQEHLFYSFVISVFLKIQAKWILMIKKEVGRSWIFICLGVCHLYQGKTCKINGTLWWLSWKTSSTKCNSQIYQIIELFFDSQKPLTIQERSGKQECGTFIMNSLWVARWSSVNEFNPSWNIMQSFIN